MSPNRMRTFVLTGAVSAVTAVGAWYGAGLKTQQEFSQERKVIHEASTGDKISQLELSRARFVQQKLDLQKKIDDFTARSQGKSTSTDLSTPRGR